MQAWANIDIPLKSYTIHLDHDTCPHVVEIAKNRPGVEEAVWDWRMEAVPVKGRSFGHLRHQLQG